MQYVQIEIQSRLFLMSTREVTAVDSFGCISDSPKPDEQTTPFVICYGAYMPQSGLSEEKALCDLLGAKGNWLGHISGPICQLIAVQDIRSFGAQKVGRMTYLRFAALIQAHESVIDEIKGGDSQAVTGFVRYANMSPADNLLNRQGLFALKSVEHRIKGDLTLELWDKSIDRSRVLRTAKNIK
jgi:hypothetical protein